MSLISGNNLQNYAAQQTSCLAHADRISGGIGSVCLLVRFENLRSRYIELEAQHTSHLGTSESSRHETFARINFKDVVERSLHSKVVIKQQGIDVSLLFPHSPNSR